MRRRFVVRGMVQGVFFRAAAAEEARALGLTGRVWNREDGAVECVAEGSADAIERFRSWLRRGPPRARVEEVQETELSGETRYPDFAVARE